MMTPWRIAGVFPGSWFVSGRVRSVLVRVPWGVCAAPGGGAGNNRAVSTATASVSCPRLAGQADGGQRASMRRAAPGFRWKQDLRLYQDPSRMLWRGRGDFGEGTMKGVWRRIAPSRPLSPVWWWRASTRSRHFACGRRRRSSSQRSTARWLPSSRCSSARPSTTGTARRFSFAGPGRARPTAGQPAARDYERTRVGLELLQLR